MRRLGTLLALVIIILAGVLAFGLVRLYNQEQTAGDESRTAVQLMREMIIPATPAVMPDPLTIVREVTQLARLETASFVGEKVLVVDNGSNTLFGAFNESIVFIAYGEVIAGIDFAQMADGDIQVVDPTTVLVHLPPAEILVSRLDNERSRVVDRDQGLLVAFAGADPQLETVVRQQGEQLIVEAALEYGLLREAEANGRAYMENFLSQLGFETITFTDETPPVPAPFEQQIPKGYELATPEP